MAEHNIVATKLLRLADVMARVGLGRTAIYARMDAGVFPRSVKLSERCARWRSEEIDKWVANPKPLPRRE